jgi:hypothetical protein
LKKRKTEKMSEQEKETIVQVPLTAEYVVKLDADCMKDDRTRARQGAFILKAYYDGRLQWNLPGMESSPSVAERIGGVR